MLASDGTDDFDRFRAFEDCFEDETINKLDSCVVGVIQSGQVDVDHARVVFVLDDVGDEGLALGLGVADVEGVDIFFCLLTDHIRFNDLDFLISF